MYVYKWFNLEGFISNIMDRQIDRQIEDRQKIDRFRARNGEIRRVTRHIYQLTLNRQVDRFIDRKINLSIYIYLYNTYFVIFSKITKITCIQMFTYGLN